MEPISTTRKSSQSIISCTPWSSKCPSNWTTTWSNNRTIRTPIKCIWKACSVTPRIVPNRIWHVCCGTRMQRGVLILWKQQVDSQVQRSLPLLPGQTFIDGSKILQVQGTPAHALLHTYKYLVGDVTINMCIDLQPEAFCLMSHAGTERLEILNAEFMVRYVKISDTVRLQHIAIMLGVGRKHPQPALYPLERGDVQAYNIAQGLSSFPKKDLFLGKVPRRVVVGLVRNDAYVGDKARNPFNFQVFHLKSLKLLVNGEEYPAPGIELEDNGHVNGYNSLFLGSGTMHWGEGLQVEHVKCHRKKRTWRDRLRWRSFAERMSSRLDRRSTFSAFAVFVKTQREEETRWACHQRSSGHVELTRLKRVERCHPFGIQTVQKPQMARPQSWVPWPEREDRWNGENNSWCKTNAVDFYPCWWPCLPLPSNWYPNYLNMEITHGYQIVSEKPWQRQDVWLWYRRRTFS